jgi:zinc protease
MVNSNTALAPRVKHSSPIDGLDIYSLQTGIKEVVTYRGSFLGGSFFTKKNILIPEMTGAMLDLGTKKRDKFEIGEALESVGAKLDFSAGRYRVNFFGRCLKEDLSLVIELLAEQLKEPAFHQDDLKSIVQRRRAELKKQKEDTRTRAVEEFLRQLYPERHPNFIPSLDDKIVEIEKVTTEDLMSFHNDHYGLGSMKVSFVGDVDHRTVEQEVDRQFRGWKKTSLKTEQEVDLVAKTVNKAFFETVQVPDKTSADLVTGHGIGIHREHKDYYSVMMGHFILGGNFSARLMATVRDQEGLTYGIQSATGGVEEGNDGYWYIWGTFGPDVLETAKKSISRELCLWHEKGVTLGELTAKQSTITGTYKVGLDTTAGLATRILTTVERGKELSFMDEYPDIINNLTLDQVNAAIRSYCNPDNRITIVAGTVNNTN